MNDPRNQFEENESDIDFAGDSRDLTVVSDDLDLIETESLDLSAEDLVEYVDLEEEVEQELELKARALVRWEAFSFSVGESNKFSRISLFLILVSLMVFAAVSRSFTSFFVIMGLILLLYASSRVDPEIVTHEITVEGVNAFDEFIKFMELDGFWIEYTESVQELVLVRDSGFMNKITLQLGESNPNVLRAVLERFIPELPVEKSFLDNLSRFLHF